MEYNETKLRKIYKEYEEYQELSDTAKQLFDQLFPVLWIEEKIDRTNEYLASRFGYQKSTIEKKLRQMERSHLIYRSIIRRRDDLTGRWTTHRDITLDDVFKCKISSALKLIPKGYAKQETEKIEENIENEEDLDEYLPKIVKNKPNFNFKKIKR